MKPQGKQLFYKANAGSPWDFLFIIAQQAWISIASRIAQQAEYDRR